MKIGILGAGLTGLTIANNLKCDFEILEKESICGGLCRSFSKKGFTFDIGGHILFSRNKETLNEMTSLLGKNKIKGVRNNKIFFKGKFVKYPFENGLSDLSEEDNKECLNHFLNNPFKNKPKNFAQWMYHTFGEGISEKYLMPYNRKIWKFNPHKMSCHWVEGRVPKPPKADIIKSSKGILTEGYKEQINFIYPKKGGIASLIKALVKKVKNNIVHFEVKTIKKNKNIWSVYNGGERKDFNKIISTIPLPDLIPMLKDVPKKVINATKSLKYNSLALVMIGLKKKAKDNKNDFTAIYFHQIKYWFHRICFMENFSKYNAPKGKSALVVEITFNKEDKIYNYDNHSIIKHILWFLRKQGFIEKLNEVLYAEVKRFEYAYVIYDEDYLKNIKIVRKYIDKIGIEICGRFGEFEYYNMDKCYERGKEMARKMNEDETR